MSKMHEISQDDINKINNYIDNLEITQKYKFLYKVSEFIDEFNFDDGFELVKLVLKNSKLCKVLNSYVKNNEINIVGVSDNYKTDTFLLILELYSDYNNIEFILDDTSYEDLFLDNNIDDSVKMYLSEIGKYKVLNPKEVKELFERLESGDETVREKIILSNLKLVIFAAKKFQNKGLSFLDLIQEGNLGLMKAIDKFEVKKGFKFSTYALYWIKQRIRRAIVDSGKTIRIPAHIHEKMSKITKTKQMLYLKLGREPTNAELADEMNIPSKNLEKLLIDYDNTNVKSINTLIGDNEDSELLDFIPDVNNNLEEEAFGNLSFDFLIEKSGLNEKEKQVIKLHYGVIDTIPHTLQEIGNIYGLTRERIRQIEEKGLEKMKKKLAKEKYECKEKQQEIDSNKLSEFEKCDDFNKFDPSRIYPKFDDKTSMGVWFEENKIIILKTNGASFDVIRSQYEKYKKKIDRINKDKEKEISKSKESTFNTGVHVIYPKPKQKVESNQYIKFKERNDIKMEEKKNAFYSMFDGTIKQVDEIIKNKLSPKKREIILRKWNQDLKKGEKSKESFTQSENAYYYLAVKNIKEALSYLKKENEVNKLEESISNTETHSIYQDTKEVQPFALPSNEYKRSKETLDESKQAVRNNVLFSQISKKDNSNINENAKKEEKKTDDNETYLKLYELVNLPYFMRLIEKIDPRDYQILFLKINYPDKTISELSKFTGVSEEKIKEQLATGVNELTTVINSMIKDAFRISDDEIENDKSYKMD